MNASCLWLEAEVQREGQLWFQRYEFAAPTSPLTQRGRAPGQGTTLSCAPAIGSPPSFDELRTLVQELTREEAGLRVKVRITDLRVERQETIVIA